MIFFRCLFSQFYDFCVTFYELKFNAKSTFRRYLKSQFPKAEETMILDVLATVENNVQKATEQLIRMGYEKREITPAPRLSHRKKEGSPAPKAAEPTPPPKPKTADEKKKCEILNFKNTLHLFEISI